MKNISGGGIYTIAHIASGKIYVGSTVSFRNRYKAHLSNLRNNRNKVVKLQHAWNKYGEHAFAFSVIEIVEGNEALLEREQYWIDKLDSVGSGYNANPIAGSSRGRHYSDEHKLKTGLASKAMWESPEYRATISKSRKDMWATKEHQEKTREGMRAAASKADVKAKVGAATKAHWTTTEYREKLTASRKAMWESKEFRENLAKQREKFMANPEYKAAHSKNRKMVGLYAKLTGSPYRTSKVADAFAYLIERGLIDENRNIKA